MTGLSTKSNNASDKAKQTIPQIMALLLPPPRHPHPSLPIPPVLIELQDITTVLSTKQRFAWLHDLYKDLLKGAEPNQGGKRSLPGFKPLALAAIILGRAMKLPF
ncbi:hypothetical protein CU097_002077 [Rhizopus azygosporus]|uniref:Uncharacterized protein n=1 Tax=Rhizopus azygosporus TaxID=86630 RepID=A0A367J205_RHIAZ|nr:hypothetical protein CU097_002077 [Rhizopus azygosporus]